MHLKYTLSTFFLSAACILLLSAYDMNEDPDGEAGATGSPGEETCADVDCHDSFELNSGPGSVEISSPDLVDWAYVPGEVYTINVTVSQTNQTLFGLGFEALKSNGDNAGLLVAGDDTQIRTKNVSGFLRKNITHDDDTGLSDNSHTFTFTWEAPSTDIGDITFYVAGNACDDNGEEDGDYVYNTSQIVSTALGVLDSEKHTEQLEIYPNPCLESFRLSVLLEHGGNIEFVVYDAKGTAVMNLGKFNQPSGKFSRTFNVSTLPTGTYLLQVNVDGVQFKSQMFKRD